MEPAVPVRYDARTMAKKLLAALAVPQLRRRRAAAAHAGLTAAGAP